MLNELILGPAEGRMHHVSHGTFASGTPQVVSLAYISEKPAEGAAYGADIYMPTPC